MFQTKAEALGASFLAFLLSLPGSGAIKGQEDGGGGGGLEPSKGKGQDDGGDLGSSRSKVKRMGGHKVGLDSCLPSLERESLQDSVHLPQAFLFPY